MSEPSGDKPSCIEEKTYDLCFGDPLYRRLQKLVGNDKVMADAALGADPFTHIKREVLHNMLTIMTHFTGGIPTVNKEAPCLPITQARGFTARSDKGRC